MLLWDRRIALYTKKIVKHVAIVLIACVLLLAYLFLGNSTNNEHVAETDNLISKRTAAKNFDSLLHAKGLSTAEVREFTAGMFLNNIYDINILENTFKATFWLWIRGDDSLLISDLTNTNYFDIFDAKQITTRIKYVAVKKEYIGWLLYDVTFVKDWNVTNYPFDKHKIKVEVEPAYEDARIIKLIPDTLNSTFEGRTTYSEWEFSKERPNVSCYVNTYESNFGDLTLPKPESCYASIRYEKDISRKDGLNLYFKVFAGLFIGFIICMSGFFVLPDSVARFSLHIAGFIIAVTNKINVDKTIPQYTSFTLSDYLHLFCYVGMAIAIFKSSRELYRFRIDKRFSNPTKRTVLEKRYYTRGRLQFWVFLISIILLNATLSITMAILEYHEVTR